MSRVRNRHVPFFLAGVLVMAAILPGCMAAFAVPGFRTNIEWVKDEIGTLHVEWDEATYKGAVLGFVEVSDPVLVNELCPTGIIRVEQKMRQLDAVLQFLTLHMYNPQTVSVFCSDGTAVQTEFARDGLAIARRRGRWRRISKGNKQVEAQRRLW